MRTILSLVALLFITSLTYAQTSQQINVSTEKIKENGIIKYVHHIKKGETMYSLSKAYGVTTEDIINNNPNLKGGLQVGMIIFIPTVTTTSVEPKQQQLKLDEKKYTKHVAKWFETIDDIAIKYNVSVEDLMALNKLTSKVLPSRITLFIPNKTGNVPTTEEDNTQYITQNKQDKQVKQDKQDKQDKQVNIVNTSNVVNTVIENEPDIISTQVTEPQQQRRNTNETLKISVILPLNSRDSLGLNFNFMDFYAGSLLAINKLKEQGISMEIDIFDQSSYSSVKNLAATGILNNSQMIIGPVRGNDIQEILPFSERNNIPVISPMDQSAEQYILNNPYLIHTPTNTNTQIENLVIQLKKDYRSSKDANILLCYEKGSNDTSFLRITKEYLDAYGLKYSTISYGILEGRNMLSKINSIINLSKNNLVIVPSNSEAFVSDLVRNLNLTLSSVKENTIYLYGLPKWRNLETIEPEYFHKMNLHLALPYYIDYDNEEVKDFLLKFRALYKAEPSPYAFQGYDITKYFVNMLNQYGKSFINVTNMENGKMLQSDYSFSRDNMNSGFENKATRNVRYNPDYSISTIK